MNLDLSSVEWPIRLRMNVPMSDEMFLRFSAENDPFRMEMEPNGEILIMTPTHTDTGFINSRIARALGNWADQDGRGDVGESSTGFRLSNGAVRSPDAAWVSHRRLEALSKEERKGFAALCPEFVIELTSPTDRLKNVKAKMDEWIANGAELGWLIDPKARRVTVYRPGQEPEVLDDPSSVQGTGCVAGFELVMEKVWGTE